MEKNLYKRVVIFYGVSLLIVASLRFFPWINDAEGRLFGLFHLDWLDDIVHTFTGVWGLVALKKGRIWCETFLIVMGGMYFLDSLIGLSYGQNPLHIGFWTGEPLYMTAISRLLINGPHAILGGLAFFYGLSLKSQSVKTNV